MTHILRIWQSKLTSIYKLMLGKASQKFLQICSFNYFYRTTYKKVSTYSEREFGSQWKPLGGQSSGQMLRHKDAFNPSSMFTSIKCITNIIAFICFRRTSVWSNRFFSFPSVPNSEIQTRRSGIPYKSHMRMDSMILIVHSGTFILQCSYIIHLVSSSMRKKKNRDLSCRNNRTIRTAKLPLHPKYSHLGRFQFNYNY